MGRLVLAMVGFVIVLPLSPASASSEVYGSGSTWSQIAVDQWRADVATPQWGNLTLNYQGTGSTAGRTQYYSGVSDFAVSELPFQPNDCELGTCTNEVALAARRPYAYLPIVAGGTSFMYNLSWGGQRVTDLQLSPRTIAGIFTGTIAYWDDPQILGDYGKPLPHQPITPVIRSDGSGTSAQFTAFMASQTPDLWSAFCAKVGLSPCTATSLYPSFSNIAVQAKAQALSTGVSGYVAAPYGSGAINYVEYGYARQLGFPVASVLNPAGYFTQPTAADVAIALTRATLNADLTQNLGGVYTNPDPRTYPISSYSYMIVPTTTDNPFTAAKGAVLGAFINYFVCDGQMKAEPLGYSPLPTNLVRAALAVEQKIPGAPPPHSIGNCNNPAVTGAFNPSTAPPPPPTSKKGARRGGGSTSAGGPGSETATTNVSQAGQTAGPTGGAGTDDATQLASPVPASIRGRAPSALFLVLGLVLALVIIAPPVIGVSRRRRSQTDQLD